MNKPQKKPSITYIQSELEKIQDIREKEKFLIGYADKYNDFYIELFKTDERAWKRQGSIDNMIKRINAYPECQTLNFFIGENNNFPVKPDDTEKEEIKVLYLLKNEIIKIQTDIEKDEENKETKFQDSLPDIAFNCERNIKLIDADNNIENHLKIAQSMVNEVDELGGIDKIKMRVDYIKKFAERRGIDLTKNEEYNNLKSIKENHNKAARILNTPNTGKVNKPKVFKERYELHKIFKVSGEGELDEIFELLKERQIIDYKNIKEVLCMKEMIEIKSNDDPHEWTWSIIESLKDLKYINISLKRGVFQVIKKVFFYKDKNGIKKVFDNIKFNSDRDNTITYTPEIKKILNN